MKIPEEVQKALKILSKNGHEAFIVGGCVRDIFMGKTPSDYDITTSAGVEETAAAFSGYRIIETGIKHGTVTVIIGNMPLEITTYRIDGKYKDNRRPESVSFTTSIEEDLKRRDFTVNAMAYNEKRGLVDLFGGAEDIEKRLIKCVGSPDKRFGEDALRILRALRFASVTGFDIEKNTALSIKRNKELLKNISAERIYSELTKTLTGAPDKILNEFSDVFELIFPNISINGNINGSKNDKYIRLSLLSENGGAEQLKKLKADNKTVYTVKEILSFFERLTPDPIGLRLAAGKLKRADFGQLEDFCRNSVRFSRFLPFVSEEFGKITGGNECISLRQLAVNGKDITSPEPAQTGRILNEILIKVIKKELLNDKTAITDYLKNR